MIKKLAYGTVLSFVVAVAALTAFREVGGEESESTAATPLAAIGFFGGIVFLAFFVALAVALVRRSRS